MSSEKKCHCRRWAISLSSVFESDQLEKLYRRAVQCISPEEFVKAQKYHHREDVLDSVLGKLILRHATCELAGVKWPEVVFKVTEKGKPYLASPEDVPFGMNISHQGNYVAFSSSCTKKVGVDIMKLETERNNRTADQYIDSVAKAASKFELGYMRGQATEPMKMIAFYRLWCLKEAVLKATGEGLIDDLSRLDFLPDETGDKYRPGCFITGTTVKLDGEPQEQWSFEESYIDRFHNVAVCREKTLPRTCVFRREPETKIFFAKLTIEKLLENAEVLNALPNDASDAYENFISKPRRNF